MNNVITSIKQRISSAAGLTRAFAVLWGISSIVLGIGLAGNHVPIQITGAVLGTAYVLRDMTEPPLDTRRWPHAAHEPQFALARRMGDECH